jgi:hypothetical protein
MPELRWSHIVVVPDRNRQPDGRVIVALPVVVVPSVYVPSDFAVQVPLTLTDPETPTSWQWVGSRPAIEKSMFVPLNFKHGDDTLQVPTTSPPQALTSLGQVAGAPVLLPVPAVPVELPGLELQAAEKTAETIAKDSRRS